MVGIWGKCIHVIADDYGKIVVMLLLKLLWLWLVCIVSESCPILSQNWPILSKSWPILSKIWLVYILFRSLPHIVQNFPPTPESPELPSPPGSNFHNMKFIFIFIITFMVVLNMNVRTNINIYTKSSQRLDCETALVGKERLNLKKLFFKERLYLKKSFLWFYLKKSFVERNALLSERSVW